ncbi:hypothetical protein [Pseudomonas fluorescens]|uniref:hypothetical protein n=1 Tax=Pseudomonas fluorescens TaxID=294 RepID=UPI003CFE7004
MEAVTVDTNVLPVLDLAPIAASAGYKLEVVSVTNRELANTDLAAGAATLGETPETLVLSESYFGMAVLGDLSQFFDFEKILAILSSNGFPRNRETLTARQRNQLRDAMILQSHIRSGKKIFVSNDSRGFVKNGRREVFENLFGIRIFTKPEFIEHCEAVARSV